MSDLALTKQEPQAVARPEPDALDMMRAVIEKGVTAENVAVMQELVKLKKVMDDQKAERDFAAAFVALQTEMPAVKAIQPVPNNDGSVRYRFAPYEEIMAQVLPFLKKHGFSVTFSTEFAEGRLIKTCTLQHIGGHSKSNKFAVRIGSGPPKATECQADGAASTYAKRFALCDALNIQIDHDTDARAEGQAVTPEQAAEIEHRVKMLNLNVEAFLKYAHTKSFADIHSATYPMIDDFLQRKERGK